MGSISTIMSMGTLLSQAQDAGATVRLLVEGQWITGTPVSCDGHGVVIRADEGEFLLRLEAVSAIAYDEGVVRVPDQRAGW